MSFCVLRCPKTANFRLTKSPSAPRDQHRRARPISAGQSRVLVLGHSGGSMVSRLKTICRILVRHRFLLSAGFSAAAGIILRSIVLIPAADPLFRYAALQRPSMYVAFVWSFAIFLFTTPFLMLSMGFSLLYIHFYEEETAETLGTLPEYPEPQYRQDLFLILGELHHQLEASPAAHPQWLSIPEKGLYTGIAALGAIGSGKTRGVILPAMHQLFGYKRVTQRGNCPALFLKRRAISAVKWLES